MRAPVVSPLHKTVPLFAVAVLMLGLVPMLGVQAAAMAEEAEGSEGAGDAVALASELSSSGEGEPAGDVDAEGADVGAVALVGASQLSREVALQPLSEDGSGVLLLADALAGKPTCFVNQEVALDSNASVLGSFIVDGMTYAVTGEGAVELVAVGPAALAGDLLAGLAEAVPVGSDGVLSGEGFGSGVPTSPSPSPEGASSDDAEGDPASEPAILEVSGSVEYDGTAYIVVAIGPRAFAGCDADVVTIPAAVESIDELAFRGSAVASVEVADGNPNFSSYDGMLFDADMTSLLLIPEGKQGAARIPKTASSVPPDALSHCASVTSVEVEAGSAAYSSRNGCLYDAEGGALALSPSAGAGAGSPLAGSMGLARASSASFAPVTFDGNGCYMSLVRMYNHQSETFETVKGCEKLSSFTLSPGMVVNGERILDPDCLKELTSWEAGWWNAIDQWNYGLHADLKGGYKLVGWKRGDGHLVTFSPEGRAPILSGETYIAQWEAETYSVNLKPRNDPANPDAVGEVVKVTYGERIEGTHKPAWPGHRFLGYFMLDQDDPDRPGSKVDVRYIDGDGKGCRAWDKASGLNLNARWVADLRVDVPIAVDLDLMVDWEQGHVVASGPDGSEHATGEFRSWSSGEVQVAAFGQEAGTAAGHRASALGLFGSGDEAKAENLSKVSLVLSADADGAQRLSFPLSGLYELPADRPPHGAMASPQDLAPLDLVVPPASSVSSPGTLRVRYGIDCAADLPLSDVAIDERPRPILKLVYEVGLA